MFWKCSKILSFFKKKKKVFARVIVAAFTQSQMVNTAITVKKAKKRQNKF